MLGKIKSITIGTPAMTFDKITNAKVSLGVEIQEHFYESHYPYVTIGNREVEFSCEVADDAALALVQGMRVSDVSFVYSGVGTSVSSDLSLVTAPTGVTVTLSSGIISDVVEINVDNTSKDPALYSIVIKPCHSEAGEEPVISRTFAVGGIE